ncbi:MAG: CopD family protein [Betaproteobacteria bacterium]|nr:CopD family protein [Betaproteobacteria bacterium]
MNLVPLLLFLHLLGVTIWVGGMFFAYVCLRPVAAAQLQPPQRLALWAAVFARFFPWVWLAVILLPASGFGVIVLVGWGSVPPHWHVMMTLGFVMMMIFGHIYFASYPRLCQGVAATDWSKAGAALNQIRKMVGINLGLGLLTITVATLGTYFRH